MLSHANFRSAVDFALQDSLLAGSSVHGEEHWRAVAAQGLSIAKTCDLGRKGAAVAALFGLFHDCRRENEDYDPEHGLRGGERLLACPELRELDAHYGRGTLNLLMESCLLHDSGQVTENLLLGLGWDADRSVLTRCGIVPSFHFFSCIPAEHFAQLIEDGIPVSNEPPSWDDIWQRAFAA